MTASGKPTQTDASQELKREIIDCGAKVKPEALTPLSTIDVAEPIELLQISVLDQSCILLTGSQIPENKQVYTPYFNQVIDCLTGEKVMDIPTVVTKSGFELTLYNAFELANGCFVCLYETKGSDKGRDIALYNPADKDASTVFFFNDASYDQVTVYENIIALTRSWAGSKRPRPLIYEMSADKTKPPYCLGEIPEDKDVVCAAVLPEKVVALLLNNADVTFYQWDQHNKLFAHLKTITQDKLQSIANSSKLFYLAKLFYLVAYDKLVAVYSAQLNPNQMCIDVYDAKTKECIEKFGLKDFSPGAHNICNVLADNKTIVCHNFMTERGKTYTVNTFDIQTKTLHAYAFGEDDPHIDVLTSGHIVKQVHEEGGPAKLYVHIFPYVELAHVQTAEAVRNAIESVLPGNVRFPLDKIVAGYVGLDIKFFDEKKMQPTLKEPKGKEEHKDQKGKKPFDR